MILHFWGRAPMTRRTNARIAGIAFLLYIAATILSLVLFGRATSEEGSRRRSGIAEHVTDVRVVVLLDLINTFCAIVLGVTLWAITREQDRDLAMLALICRVARA